MSHGVPPSPPPPGRGMFQQHDPARPASGQFASPLSQGYHAQPQAIAQPAFPQAPLPVAPRRRSGAVVVWVIGILAVLLVALVAYFLQFLGSEASIIGMVLALLPLAGVLLAVRLVDHWEPEPRGLMALAFAGGAIGAVGLLPWV